MQEVVQTNFIEVNECDDKNRLEVCITGYFPAPEEVADGLSYLREKSNSYSTIMYYISSLGGDSRTLKELICISNLYDNVITVNTSYCASAGFIMWCSGDLRVANRYSTFLAHRERYTHSGPTSTHIDNALFTDFEFRRLFSDVCGDVLTSEEIEEACYKDIRYSDLDFISRGCAISYEDFLENENTKFEHLGDIISKDGIMYLVDGDEIREIAEMTVSQECMSRLELIHGLHSEVEDDEESEEVEQEEPETEEEKTEILLETDGESENA